MAKLIEGKVAQIISIRELAINKGEVDGVREGMRFRVLSESPLTVADPDSGDDLGTVDREKVQVEATEVYARFSICRTFETRVVGSAWALSMSSIYAQLAAVPRTVARTLKVDDSQLPQPLSEEQSYVKTGDRVIQIPQTRL
jgi:hypothetical protein